MPKNAVFKKVKASDVTVGWKWYDEGQGLVEWTFTNDTTEQKSVILLRSGYYFGNAFWPVYESNAEFDTKFAQSVVPLTDNGVENNSPPLFVAEINGKYIVCFLFTLAPGQTWSMLEGGFVDGMEPTGATLYDVTDVVLRTMCVGYDESQVTDWDQQTGTSLGGYSPNPDTFDVIVGQVSGPYIQLFNDPISQGQCSSGSPAPKNCDQYISRAIADLQAGSILKGIDELLTYIDCAYMNVIDGKQSEMRKIFERIRKKF